MVRSGSEDCETGIFDGLIARLCHEHPSSPRDIPASLGRYIGKMTYQSKPLLNFNLSLLGIQTELQASIVTRVFLLQG